MYMAKSDIFKIIETIIADLFHCPYALSSQILRPGYGRILSSSGYKLMGQQDVSLICIDVTVRKSAAHSRVI